MGVILLITTITALMFWIFTPMGATIEAWEYINYWKPRIILMMYGIGIAMSIVVTIQVWREKKKGGLRINGENMY